MTSCEDLHLRPAVQSEEVVKKQPLQGELRVIFSWLLVGFHIEVLVQQPDITHGLSAISIPIQMLLLQTPIADCL